MGPVFVRMLGPGSTIDSWVVEAAAAEGSVAHAATAAITPAVSLYRWRRRTADYGALMLTERLTTVCPGSTGSIGSLAG